LSRRELAGLLGRHMSDSPELINAGEGVTLAVPRDWTRTAIVVFANGGSGQDVASVVVRRESLDPHITLQQYTDHMLVELARTLPSFELQAREARELSAHPAMELRYTLTTRGESHQQRQVCAVDRPGSVLSLVFSSGATHAQAYEPVWEQMLASVIIAPQLPDTPTASGAAP